MNRKEENEENKENLVNRLRTISVSELNCSCTSKLNPSRLLYFIQPWLTFSLNYTN